MNLDELLALKAQHPTPIVVCLCGSMRFAETFEQIRVTETLAGKIVLKPDVNTKQSGIVITEEQKIALDLIHLAKIEHADEVLVINVGGYLGESTRRELEYAQRLGKHIRWLEPPKDEPTDEIWFDLYCGPMNEQCEHTTDLTQIATMIHELVEIGDCFDVYVQKDGKDIGYGEYTLFKAPNYAVGTETGRAKGLWKAINEHLKQQEA